MSSSIPSDRRTRWKVLIVEDELIVAYDLAGKLRTAGFGVLGPVATVEDALAYLRSTARRPDIVLLGVALGDGWSTPVAETLCSRGIPYVVTTGYDREELLEPVLQDAPYLPKPVSAAKLSFVISGIAGRARCDPAVLARPAGHSTV
ncbi:response regulator [Benzoatithermus flavus]|uniref:Response regulatory domain-containing protein n=1 Tax=Benzoatithermus flavus TaxID=3108223 RepID=A0ABU8XYF4_9PROT